MNERRDSAPAELYFIASAVSLYLGASIAVSLFDEMPPGAVALLRVASACVFLVGWRKPWRRSWTRTQVIAAASFGVATAGMNLTFYMAADRIDLGAGVAIEFIGPVAVAALGARTPRNLAALALAVSGILVMTSFATGDERTGIALALVAGVLWGSYIILGRRVAIGGGGIDGLGIGMAFGAVAIIPFGVGGLGPIGDRPLLLLAAASVGLFSNLVPYSLDQITMARLPRDRFALLLALLPATAVLMGWLLLDQTPSGREAIGIALIVTAIGARERAGERVRPGRSGPGATPPGPDQSL